MAKGFLSVAGFGLAVMLAATSAAATPSLFSQAAPAERLKADFNGDGVIDEAVFAFDPAAGLVRVRIRLNDENGGAQTVEVFSMQIDDKMSAALAAPGEYKRDCGSFSDACTETTLAMKTPGLLLRTPDGAAILVRWTGRSFEPDFVRGAGFDRSARPMLKALAGDLQALR